MDKILAEQLSWLLSGNMEGIRFKRQLILLAGCLADGAIPSDIDQQLTLLSKRVALEEVFRALLAPIEAYLRNGHDQTRAPLDLSRLMLQVEATRQALNDGEPINQALVIAWLMGRARERKLLGKMLVH